jgi:hypothetical protein
MKIMNHGESMSKINNGENVKMANGINNIMCKQLMWQSWQRANGEIAS